MNTTAMNYTLRTSWSTWSIYCYSVLAVAIVITNGILITVIGSTKSLHVNRHIYVFALGLADFSVGLIAIPIILIATEIKLTDNPYYCLAMLSVNFYSTFLSVGVLFLLALDRCFFITKPLRYRTWMTRFKTIMALVTVNTSIFLWGFAPLFGWNKLSLGLITMENLYCSPQHIVMPTYVLASLVIYFILQSIQITCFAFIAYTAWRHRKNINKMRSSTQTLTNRPSISLRATIVLALLVFTSAAGWIPLMFIQADYYGWFTSQKDTAEFHLDTERDVLLLIAFLTSLINPLVYGFGTKAVNEATLKMFYSKCCRRETSDQTDNTEVSVVTTL